MTRFVANVFYHIYHDERGVTLVEYGIALTLALVVGGAAFIALGGEIGGATAAAGAEMPN